PWSSRICEVSLRFGRKSDRPVSALGWPVAISDFVTVQPLLFGRFRASGGFQHVVYRLTEPRCGLRSWCDCVLHWPVSAACFGVVARFGDDDARLRQRVFYRAGSPALFSARERFLRGEASWARIGA